MWVQLVICLKRVYYSPTGIEKILKISTSRFLRALLKYGYSNFRL